MEAACSASSGCDDIDSESNLKSFNCERLNAESQHHGCTNMNSNVEIDIKEDYKVCSESKKGSFIDELIKMPVNGVHLQEDIVANSMKFSTCMESGLPVSFDGSVEKCLHILATFPSSKMEVFHSFCVEENAASPNQAESSEDVSVDQFMAYRCSDTLASPSKLVSALKGGRLQNGMTSKMGLRVKWAADVYDPPASLMFPAVQSNGLRRPKTKKDKRKHKHAKGKASRVGR